MVACRGITEIPFPRGPGAQRELILCKDLQLPRVPGFSELCSGVAPWAPALLCLGLVNIVCSLE